MQENKIKKIYLKKTKNKTNIQLSNIPHKAKTTKKITKINTSLNDKDDDNLLLLRISFIIIYLFLIKTTCYKLSLILLLLKKEKNF